MAYFVNNLNDGEILPASTLEAIETGFATAEAAILARLVAANNLSDLADAATALTNLGLTATASEINTALDGTSVTAAELDLLSGKTSVATLGANTLTGNQTIIGDIYVKDATPHFIFKSPSETNTIDIFANISDVIAGGLQIVENSSTVATFRNGRLGIGPTKTNPSVELDVAGTIHSDGVVVPTISSTSTFTNKTHTNPVLNGTATGTAIGTGATQIASGNHTHSSLQAISFRAYVTADESAVGSGVVNSTNLSNLSEDFDNGGYFAIATGYFQPSVAGYYHVGMSLYLTTNLAGDNIEGTIRKNAAGTIMAIDNTESDSSSKEGGVSPSTTMYFNGSTDYVYFYHDQSTGWTMKAGSQIYGHFVHA